jgi:competence ComEA-like helix-hairpin-helix protein
MIFTPEERRALLALGSILVFGQALAWWQDWRAHRPDRELATWLDQVAGVRAQAESAGDVSVEPVGPVEPADPAVSSDSGAEDGPADPFRPSPRSEPAPEPVRIGHAEDLPPGILADGRVRLNLATAEELATLPGIGPALAARIVAAREEAPFRAVDDLRRVKGIGAKTLERLRPHVSVETPPTGADSSRGEQHVDAAENRRRSETGAGGPHFGGGPPPRP